MKKEALSSFMDDELSDNEALLASLSNDRSLLACWHRYHIVSDAIKNQLHPDTLTMDISEKISHIITTMEPKYSNRSRHTFYKKILFYFKVKHFFDRMTQFGLVTGMTLSIIIGVQFYNSKMSPELDMSPRLNTMPVGINVSPVGGVNPVINTPEEKVIKNKISQEKYEKIHFLLQEHELQKRFNANK